MSTADGWATGDPAYFAAEMPPQARTHFNMLRIAGNPHSRRDPRPVPLRTFFPNPDDPSREENNRIILLRVASYYGDNANVSDFPADSRLLVYLHLHSDADTYAGNERSQPSFRDESALFCALGWYVHTNETLRQFDKARDDVKLGKDNLMRLIFIIGARYMNANINLALVTADEDSQRGEPGHREQRCLFALPAVLFGNQGAGRVTGTRPAYHMNERNVRTSTNKLQCQDTTRKLILTR